MTQRIGKNGQLVEVTLTATALVTVTEFGGELSIESELGRGTCCRLRLPIRRGSVSSVFPAARPDVVGGRGRILVVDDDLHRWLTTEHPLLAAKVVFMTGGAFTPNASEYLVQVGNRQLEKPYEVAKLRPLMLDLVARAKRQH